MEDEKSVIISIPDLHKLLRDVLVCAGTLSDTATIVSKALVDAERDGIPSHGAGRTLFYAEQVKSGKINGNAEPTVSISGSTVTSNAGNGFAFPAIKVGLDAGLNLLKKTGTVTVAVNQSHHAGVLGHHTEYAAVNGALALGVCNTPSAMAPWGGKVSVFGTNPIAFACPRYGTSPLVIDLSLSKVARGKIMLAKQQGRTIPEGWALDHDGAGTTDPETALQGSMLPMADEKGAALALMVEVLAAALTGANFSSEATSFFTAEGPPPNVGQAFILIDPYRFAENNFVNRIEVLFEMITGQEGTRLPGTRRLANRTRADSSGIKISKDLYLELCKIV